MSQHVKVESKNRVMTITIDRGGKLNALTADMAGAISQAWEDFSTNDDRVAVLTGTDEVFTAGADLIEAGGSRREGWEVHRCVPGMFAEIHKPIISAVAGWCVGAGLYMMQATDLCVAAENATFVYPEAKWGMGGSWVPTGTATRIPLKVAMEIALLGKPMTAQRAYEVGMVNEVVPVGRQLERAYEYADIISKSSPSGIRSMMRHVKLFGPQVRADSISNWPDQLTVLRSADERAEGMAAFRDGREPDYSSF